MEKSTISVKFNCLLYYIFNVIIVIYIIVSSIENADNEANYLFKELNNTCKDKKAIQKISFVEKVRIYLKWGRMFLIVSKVTHFLIQHSIQHMIYQYLIPLNKQECRLGYLKSKYLQLNWIKILLMKLEMMKKT